MKCSTNDFAKTYQPTPQYKWVQKVFPKNIKYNNLTFIDLAANHPIYQSNTYLLEKSGWKGICIDANTECIRLLQKMRSCTIWNTVVSNEEQYINFTYKNEMGGIVNEKYDNTENEKIISRKAHSLQYIIDHLNLKKIDYLSLDVEGAEEDVLSIWSTPISTMTIERPSPLLCQRLFKKGYLYAGNFGDTAFIHKSHPKALRFSQNETFKYPVAKCRNHKYGYKNRIPLKGSCKSIFGCCSFPGFPPHLYEYQ